MTRLLAIALIAFLPLQAGAADVAPAEDYALHCAACHGLDGTGGVLPSLHGRAKLVAAPGGREYMARVPGVAQAALSDERLARLLNWVLAEFSGAKPKPPYTAPEVGRLRADPFRDPLAARRAVLDAAPN